MKILPIVLCLGLPAGDAAAQDQDGEVMFNNVCRTCHTVKEGDNRLGPSLAGVVGRKAGSLQGFPFSDALKKSNLVWDEATLDRFIQNPDEVVRGNGMKPYAGMPNQEERAAIIAFLKAH
jgi:cytochrome c